MLDKLKKYKSAGIIALILIGVLFLISLFNVIGFLGSTLSAILNMLIGILLLFYTGFKYGQKRESKGYIAGLKVGSIVMVIMFLISWLLFRVRPNITMLIYYIILLISCILGSMVGINKKKEE